MTYDHLDIAKRWAFHRMQPELSPAPFTDRKARRMFASGDVLNSWGDHFPLVRILRTPRGKVRGLLLNGDTWSGASGWGATNATSTHQTAVLRMAEDFRDNLGIPFVTIPQSVLDAAGIDTESVTLVHRTDDWYENRTEEFDAEPVGSRWVYSERHLPGTNGWVHQRTGQFVEYGWAKDSNAYVTKPPGEPKVIYDDKIPYQERWDIFHRETRRWELEWVRVPPVTKRTGHRELIYRGHTLEQYVREDGSIGSRYSWRRHWLGESLIKAKIPYRTTVKCGVCAGTGVHPHAEAVPGVEGPLTERQDMVWRRWHNEFDPRYTIGSRIEERCERCLGRRRVDVTRRRTAYFLSGFDHNEPTASYFFTELPPKARPKTIAEAYETLKPTTARLAEELGRTVLRQGDQFFIEMPGLTLRDLKRAGGVHHRRNGEGKEKQQWEPDEPGPYHQRPRFQRFINENCWLHGTTHEATEVVRVGAVTYCRGMVRHVPDGREPDHIRLALGDRKSWFLNVPNMTPVGTR